MATPQVTIFRGDDLEVEINVKDQDGAVVDITGGRVIFTVDSLAIQIVKDSSVGVAEIEFTDPVNGELVVKLVPADTAGATPKEIGTYIFDAELQLGGKVHTLLKGFFTIRADVS